MTTRTNRDDEVQTIGGHKKFFALWPVFFDQKLRIGAEIRNITRRCCRFTVACVRRNGLNHLPWPLV